MSFARNAIGANAIKCQTLDIAQNDLFPVQRKLPKDLLTITKTELYEDFPQTDQKLPWAEIKDEVETLSLFWQACTATTTRTQQLQHEAESRKK